MPKFDAIVFDVDSTLVRIEGLDWLAECKGKKAEVCDLTKKSMDGFISFNEAMVRKMKIISPDNEDLIALGKKYCKSLVLGAGSVIDSFHRLKKDVWILTGNFQPAVGILANKLGIPNNRIICNKIYFDKLGCYQGFDIDNKLSRNGGKAEIVKKMFYKKQRVAFVGDSVTDLEVKKYVNLFIGFGGVVEREVVKRKSDFYLSDPDLYPLLGVVLTKRERESLGF